MRRVSKTARSEEAEFRVVGAIRIAAKRLRIARTSARAPIARFHPVRPREEACRMTLEGTKPTGEHYSMPETPRRRIDRILGILREHDGRMRTKELSAQLTKLEREGPVPYSAIYIAIAAENAKLEAQGKSPLFRTKRDGEQWGWVSLSARSERSGNAGTIEKSIESANEGVDGELRKALREMDWRTFESTFLQQVLERLGFQNVEVTQATRDGGVDARAVYMRGVVEARAVVSAKHWSKAKVPVDEVRNMRGIKGDEDTAIIVTTGAFSDDAKREARPGQNQRVVFLIDGDQLVEVCKTYRLGVVEVKLPLLLEIDRSAFAARDSTDADDEEDITSGDGAGPVQRFRDAMLGDDDRGISVAEVARLLGLEESTVRSYLSSEERRRDLGDRIRGDEKLRARALRLVSKRRGIGE